MADPLDISACPWAGANCKELGENSDLGKGRLMGTVHLTNCRERKREFSQSLSVYVKGREGYLKLWGSLIDKGRTRYSFSKLKLARFDTVPSN